MPVGVLVLCLPKILMRSVSRCNHTRISYVEFTWLQLTNMLQQRVVMCQSLPPILSLYSNTKHSKYTTSSLCSNYLSFLRSACSVFLRDDWPRTHTPVVITLPCRSPPVVMLAITVLVTLRAIPSYHPLTTQPTSDHPCHCRRATCQCDCFWPAGAASSYGARPYSVSICDSAIST